MPRKTHRDSLRSRGTRRRADTSKLKKCLDSDQVTFRVAVLEHGVGSGFKLFFRFSKPRLFLAGERLCLVGLYQEKVLSWLTQGRGNSYCPDRIRK